MSAESREGGLGTAPVCKLKLVDVLRDGLAQDRADERPLGAHQRRVLGTLLACRSEAAGGHLFQCADCEKEFFVPHSCRNRHCPQCQGREAAQWLERQSAAVLPVPYFHVVFTLPHVLNPLIRQNQAALYNLLFATASSTLLSFAQKRFGAVPGITAVLHTWSQTLAEHYHLHCIVSAGGISTDGSCWKHGSARYLFAVKALSAVFRARMLDGIEALFAAGKLQFHGMLAELADPAAFHHWLGPVVRRKWVVYSKRPFAGPKQVLGYLSRYTHRVAIGSGRLLALDRERHTILFRYKDYTDQGRHKQMKLSTREFMRRFSLHILPRGFQKIRHFGLLCNRTRHEKISAARALLEKPSRFSCSATSASPAAAMAEKTTTEPPVQALAAVQPRCPCCGSERVILLQKRPRRIVEASLQTIDSS